MSAVAEKIREYYASNCTDYTEEKKLFIEGLRQRGVVQGGLDLANISRTTAYMWRSLDPEFRRAWDEAKETCHDNARQSMYEMAISGKNVVASIFYLKHNCPEYHEKIQVNVNVMQGEVEERLSELQTKLTESLNQQNPQCLPLPPASTKELIADVLGIRGGGMTTATTTNPVELPRSTSSNQPD